MQTMIFYLMRPARPGHGSICHLLIRLVDGVGLPPSDQVAVPNSDDRAW